MRRFILFFIVLVTITVSRPVASRAAESEFKAVLKNGFYGGLAGALVGGAVLAFKDDPEDHLDFISKGAAIGVLAGVAFGLYQASDSLVEVEDGEMRVGIPVPRFRLDSISPNTEGVGLSFRFVRWRF